MTRIGIWIFIFFMLAFDPGTAAAQDPVRLVPDTLAAGDWLGNGGVAIDGDLAVAGAFGTDTNGVNVSGALYVWRKTGGTWEVEDKLIAQNPGPAPVSLFGWDVDVLHTAVGEFIVTSAIFDDTVWVFRNDGVNGWQWEQTITPSHGTGSNFGSFVSLAEDATGPLLLVGAEFHDFEHSHDGIRAGGAFLYRRKPSGDWFVSETDGLKEIHEFLQPATDRQENDQFGYRGRLDVSGGTTRALLSAWLDDEKGNNAGAAYVFTDDGTGWDTGVKLLGTDTVADDLFGRWASMDGDVVVVGAPRHDHSGLENAGAIYIFRFNGTIWEQEAKRTASDAEASDEFGTVVEIRGNTIVVGAEEQSTKPGSVYVFEYDGSSWTEVRHIEAPAEIEPGSAFSVPNLDGVTAIVGAPFDDNERGANAGAIFLYELASPEPVDTDGDGFLDSWETEGFTAANGTFVNLPAMGANPLRKDIFVEVHYMAGQRPSDEALDLIKASFAAAPVENPDESTGITLHIRVNEHLLPEDVIPFAEFLGAESTSGIYDWQGTDPTKTYFQDIKDAYFDASLAQVAHYCLFAHKLDFGDGTASGISRGSAATGYAASEFVVSLGGVGVGGIGSVNEQAGTFMHELGHDLGLRHGGGDGLNRKPNYLSVMNYHFQMDGLIHGGTSPLFTYSCCKLPDLDENALDEQVGVAGGTAIAGLGTKWQCGSLLITRTTSDANAPIDWNCNGQIDQGAAGEIVWVSANINGEGGPSGPAPGSLFAGHDDWSNLVFTGGAVGATGAALPPPPAATEPPAEVDREIRASIGPPAPENLKGHPTDPQTTLTWSPVSPPGGGTVSYRVYRSTAGTVQLLATTTQANYHDRSAVEGIEYVYSVASVDAFGSQGPSVAVTVVSR